MSQSEIRGIAARIAANHCTRIMCDKAAREIAAALTKVAAEGYALGLADGKVIAEPYGRAVAGGAR